MKTFLIAVAALALLTACSGNNSEYDASGVFEATEVLVSARESGEIMQFDVTEGKELAVGENVGYIDTMQLHYKKLQLQATLQAVGNRQYDVVRQIAAIKQEISAQKKELSRFENLVKVNAANQKQVDDIREHILVLEKEMQAKEELIVKGNSSVDGEVQSLYAQIASVQDRIEKSLIVSPISGTVLAKYAEQGELATVGRALYKLADMKHIYIRAYITSDQLANLRLGQSVKVYADEGESDYRQYDGTVTWISDVAEFTPKTIQTRDERANLVYAVKIAFENDGYVKRGMYGEVKFE